MAALPANLSIERLDAAQASIASEVGVLRGMASDYAKRCEALRLQFVARRRDVSQLQVLLAAVSRQRSGGVGHATQQHSDDAGDIAPQTDETRQRRTWKRMP